MSNDKIVLLPKLLEILQSLRQAGKPRIVFTNGCFDILHAGHVQYLEEAKALGDILILGLNSDASVSRLKGNSRPIIDEQNRALMLAGLQSVDYVCVFRQDTPLKMIQQIQPDVLVKGGDWAVEEIVGSEYVLEHGGEVKTIRFREGLSTSLIIDKIKRSQ